MESNLGERLQQLRNAFAESQQQMLEARRRLAALTARAEYRDGSIVVVLDAQGQIAELTFRGDSYRDLDREELSRRILSVVGEAHAQLRRSVTEHMPRSPWGGLSVEEMLDPSTELTRMLPEDLFSVGTDSRTHSRSKGSGRHG